MIVDKEIFQNRPSEGNIVQIANDKANELLIAVKKGERLQEFMDAVSGIENYRLNNLSKQGHIRSMFAKELISEQFLLEFEEIISVFWHGVFERLDKAKLHGELVEIKAPGKTKEFRPTNNNPIHYLRYHGRYAARNYISYLYRRNLEQGCNNCGYRTTVKNNKECPHCENIMSTMYKFSELDFEHDNLSHDTIHQDIESVDIDLKINTLINRFAEDELKQGTRAYQILKILTDPTESIDMCAACGLCDAKTFDIDSCTNYNANIGKWLGVNKTMIASKIRRIRNALPKWLSKQKNDESEYVLNILPGKYRALR